VGLTIGDDTATAFAEQKEARLAVGHRAVGVPTPLIALACGVPGAPRLPAGAAAPNGSPISAAADGMARTVAATLPNATTVSAWLTVHRFHGYGTAERPSGRSV
jgi:2-phosphosulfolactate phosphatase